MAAKFSKELPMMGYPRTLLTILASVGGLALFLMLASSILISQPIGHAVRNYFYGVDNLKKIGVVILANDSVANSSIGSDVVGNVGVLNSTTLEKNRKEADQSGGSEKSDDQGIGKGDEIGKRNQESESRDSHSSSESVRGGSSVEPSSSNVSNTSAVQTGRKDENHVLPSDEIPGSSLGGSMNAVNSSASTNKSYADSTNPECDLYHGKWVHDSAGPLYTNNSCPVLTQMQNCQGNGRPDKDYENWRWKPMQCDLPRFDARKFLELMRGKTIAFIGDSVARNQMESMLCLLWQFEVPKNRGNRRMHRYYFRSTSTMIVRMWSSWLVRTTSEPFDSAPAGITKLHLDAPDEGFMDLITGFDVIIFSSGHWFAKQSVYILNNEIVGGQLWSPTKSKQMKVNSVEAFGISVETILTAMVTHPNYTGLTIVRSYSPDHYEGGAWNTGGSCTGKVRPATDGELAENGFTNTMHEKQVTGFNRAIKKKGNKSKLKLMDITQAFSYRHDGHPGPYRSPDPNKITKRGPDGKPPPQDCLHWCMPGPVDTWNEMVLEIIRREFEDRRIPS